MKTENPHTKKLEQIFDTYEREPYKLLESGFDEGYSACQEDMQPIAFKSSLPPQYKSVLMLREGYSSHVVEFNKKGLIQEGNFSFTTKIHRKGIMHFTHWLPIPEIPKD